MSERLANVGSRQASDGCGTGYQMENCSLSPD